MKTEKDLNRLKQEYVDISIPKELDNVVHDALQVGLKRRHRNKSKYLKVVTSMAACLVLAINISPTFADTLSEIPGLEGIIKVINLRDYKVQEDNYEASISIPQVEGFENVQLQDKLNQQLNRQGEEVYQEFLKVAEEWKKVDSAAHYSLDMNYEVVTNNEEVFVLKVMKTEIMASANQQVRFYVIDKQREVGITLPSLFNDNTYIKIITDYIKEQMAEEMKADEGKVYWILENDFAKFESIDANQKFYINEQGQLVIFFDKYEVAPGYMGASEFIIPTEVIQTILTNHDLIK